MNKQDILDEIRRTARENNGVALGVAAFRTATGIKQSDWNGIHWARWSDAVREAGHTPKEFVTAFDPDATMGAFVAFVRDLGKLPNQGELRMRRRADRTFPNDGVFANKFGARPQLVASALIYCDRHSGWDDVAAICREYLAHSPPDNEARDERKDDIEDGFVYLALMKVGREKRYKIGKADIVERRKKQIGPHLPEELELIHTISTDDAYGIEAYWHKRFDAKRRDGEWFDLNTDDVRVFKRRKFM